MSDNNNLWGWDDSMENTNPGVVEAGIVPATLMSINYGDVIRGTFNFGKGVNVYVKLNDTIDTNQFYLPTDTRSKEQADDARKKFRAVLFHIVGAYVGREKLKEVVQNSNPQSAEEFANLLIEQLPENYSEIQAETIVSYGKPRSGRKYLELPKSLRVTGAFWSVNGSSELNLRSVLDLDPNVPSDNTNTDNSEEEMDEEF